MNRDNLCSLGQKYFDQNNGIAVQLNGDVTALYRHIETCDQCNCDTITYVKN